MIKIRRAGKDDCEAIMELAKEVHDYHRNQRPEIFADVEPYSKQFYELMLKDENTYIFIALNEDNVKIAYAIITLNNYANIIMLNKRCIIMIDDFCVNKKYRRQGIGRELFDTIKAFAKERAVDAVELNIWEFNEEAKGFYAAMGMNVKSREYEINI